MYMKGLPCSAVVLCASEYSGETYFGGKEPDGMIGVGGFVDSEETRVTERVFLTH